MGWFKRIQDGITTKSAEKKEIPEGAWYQCPSCKTVVTSQQHVERMSVCNYCGHHDRIGSEGYFSILFDEGKFREIAPKITSSDPLEFEDTQGVQRPIGSCKKEDGAERCASDGIWRTQWKCQLSSVAWTFNSSVVRWEVW